MQQQKTLYIVVVAIVLAVICFTQVTAQNEMQKLVDGIVRELQEDGTISALMTTYKINYEDTDKCLAEKLDMSNLPNITSYLTSGSKFTVCKDDGATPPWMTSETTGYYVDYVNLIRNRMRQLYNNNDIDYDWYTVDVSESWFPVLKGAVDSGKCQFLISTATITDERASQVDYACSFASVKDAYLRSMLEPNSVITQLSDLNDPKYKICVQKGTTYSEVVAADFPKATVREVGAQTDCYPLVVNREVHVVFCDYFCLQTWLDIPQNTADCSACNVVSYGEAGQFALMYSNGKSGAHVIVPSMFVMIVAAIVALLF